MVGRILVVDDEKQVRGFLRMALCQAGHNVDTAEDGASALEMYKSTDYDLVITDFAMPGMTGAELAAELKKLGKSVKLTIIVITGSHLAEDDEELRGIDAFDIISKPLKLANLCDAVERAIEHHRGNPAV